MTCSRCGKEFASYSANPKFLCKECESELDMRAQKYQFEMTVNGTRLTGPYRIGNYQGRRGRGRTPMTQAKARKLFKLLIARRAE